MIADVGRKFQTRQRKEMFMPSYEYVCRECGKKFGEVLSIEQHDSKRIDWPQLQCDSV